MRPAGWYPHRWVYGERLPRASLRPITGSWTSRFRPASAMGGYEWVRYGDDALLIDESHRRSHPVEYGIFY